MRQHCRYSFDELRHMSDAMRYPYVTIVEFNQMLNSLNEVEKDILSEISQGDTEDLKKIRDRMMETEE